MRSIITASSFASLAIFLAGSTPVTSFMLHFRPRNVTSNKKITAIDQRQQQKSSEAIVSVFSKGSSLLFSSLIDTAITPPFSENKNKDMKIAICGGGIGGFALALSLVQAGFHDIQIYESVKKIKELGVGINIQPHGIRELIELGLGEELAKTGIEKGKIQYYHTRSDSL